MSAKDTGGAAFPMPGIYDVARDQINPVSEYYDAEGMTLRDYFAAKAIPIAWQSECSSPTHSADGTPTYQGLAERAYLVADAMLAARKEAQ